MKVRIVLLPDKKLTEETKKASVLIASKVLTHFKLDESHIPHVTITSLEVEDRFLKEIIKLVKNYSDFRQIKIKTNEVNIGKRTFIVLYFQEDSLIKKLREKVIQSFDKYNTENIILQQPHITLTRVISENDAQKAQRIAKDFPKRNYHLNSLAICKDGPNGTCTKIISKFPLRE